MKKTLNQWLMLLSLAVGFLLTSACAKQTAVLPDTNTEVSQAPIKEVEKIIVHYQCDQGIGEIEMRFFPHHGVAVLVLDGKTHELQEQRAASGMWYSSGQYTFRGKGQEGWLEIGRRAPIDCKAI